MDELPVEMSVYLHNSEDDNFFSEMLGGQSQYKGTKEEHKRFFMIAADYIDKIDN